MNKKPLKLAGTIMLAEKLALKSEILIFFVADTLEHSVSLSGGLYDNYVEVIHLPRW